jgi:hypothetical protein
VAGELWESHTDQSVVLGTAKVWAGRCGCVHHLGSRFHFTTARPDIKAKHYPMDTDRQIRIRSRTQQHA